jgi:hypothetical protein
MNKLIDMGDKTAVVLSLLCTLHCLALPILLILLPSVSTLLAFNLESLHLWLLFAVIPIGVISLLLGYFHHHQVHVSVIGFIGMGLLISAVMFGHDLMGGKGEAVLTILGSALIAFGHIRNLYLRNTSAPMVGLTQ